MGSVINEGSQSEETALTGGSVSRVRRQTRSEAKKTRTNAVNDLPPYNEMIMEAINENMQRTKFSHHAIIKTIRDKYRNTLPLDFNENLWKELKDLTGKGVLVQVSKSFKFPSGFNKATKSNAYQALNEPAKIVLPTTVRTPELGKRKYSTPAKPNESDDDAAESTGVPEEAVQEAEPTGAASKVFIFKGTVQNAHFQ